jgi:hypothetical protein
MLPYINGLKLLDERKAWDAMENDKSDFSLTSRRSEISSSKGKVGLWVG